jgi:hypothetical protein
MPEEEERILPLEAMSGMPESVKNETGMMIRNSSGFV